MNFYLFVKEVTGLDVERFVRSTGFDIRRFIEHLKEPPFLDPEQGHRTEERAWAIAIPILKGIQEERDKRNAARKPRRREKYRQTKQLKLMEGLHGIIDQKTKR